MPTRPVISQVMPVSSWTSRTAAWVRDSPRSMAPPGRAQLLLSERRMRSISPSSFSTTTLTEGAILLIRRSDNNNWALPGGAIDLGESLTQAAVREVQEETGITCEITGLVGIYTDPKHIILYTSNNEARQEFSVVLIADILDG